MTNHSFSLRFWLLAAMMVVLGAAFLLAAPSQPVQAQTASQDCQTCHKPVYELWAMSKHGTGGLECQVCHKLESGEGKHPFELAFSTESEELTCAVCHAEVTADWNASRHGEIGMKCISCHNPHSQQQKPVEGNQTACENCHKDQKDAAHASTHTAAGADCITCHLGTHHKHTFHVDAPTCSSCHSDIHGANQLLLAGAKIERLGDAVVQPTPAPVVEPESPAAGGGIHLPSWLMLVAGLFLGGGAMWVFIGKEPGQPA
jgi:hypothetical protein